MPLRMRRDGGVALRLPHPTPAGGLQWEKSYGWVGVYPIFGGRGGEDDRAMSNYRRMRVPGGTYFFTVNLADRSSRLLVDRIDALHASVLEVRRTRPFEIVAWVVLPDHLHAIWRLPQQDSNFATRWMRIKQSFSRRILRFERVSASRMRKGERGLWQRRYWEHAIHDERDLRNHIDYIHFNPVKHGHAVRASDWLHSSFHRFVQAGLLPSSWGDPPTCTASRTKTGPG